MLKLRNYNDVIMGAIASQITSLAIFYPSVYSDADQINHQSSVSLAFVRGIHWGPVNSPHKWPVTRKMFSFDDVIMRPSYLWHGIPKLVRHLYIETGPRDFSYWFPVYILERSLIICNATRLDEDHVMKKNAVNVIIWVGWSVLFCRWKMNQG